MDLASLANVTVIAWFINYEFAIMNDTANKQ